MKDNTEIFTTMRVGKAVAKLAVPTVISQLIVILYSMADTVFLGMADNAEVQLAALGVAFPIFTLLTAVANLFGIGANSLIARSLGQNDEQTAKKASAFCFWGSLGLTAILCALLAALMGPVLPVLGAKGEMFKPTADYLLYVFVIGGIPTVASLSLGHLVRAVGKTKEAGIGLALGGILNIALDPVFIFVFKMGVSGAAIATAISNFVSLIFFIIVMIKIKNNSCLTISPKHFTFKKEISAKTLSVGFPAAASVMLVCFSISLLTALLGKYDNGKALISAYNATAKCGTVALHISIGIAQGVMPLIGYSYGAKDHKRVKDVTKLAFIILAIFSVLFLALVQFIPNQIVSLFMLNAQAETIALGGVFMRRWSWCVIGMCLVAMFDAIFQAVGKWKTSLLIACVRFLVLFPALCFALEAVWATDGLMWVQPITDTLALVLAIVCFVLFTKSLAKHSAEEKQQEKLSTTNRIITISRQFGSGGRTIGKAVAERLGIPCYDSELIAQTAAKSGLAEGYVEKYGEYAMAETLYDNAFACRTSDGKSPSDELWLAQKQVVIDLAMQSPCVIVGRCADYILKDIADCITVFIGASDEYRAERIVNVYGEKENAPLERLHEKDKKRKAYYKLYTGIDWGNAENYALCLDSEKLGIDECVKMIIEAYNARSDS